MKVARPTPSAAVSGDIAPWQRVLAVACVLLVGPIIILPLTLAALAALPAIAFAFPFVLASICRSAAAAAPASMSLRLHPVDPPPFLVQQPVRVAISPRRRS